VQPNPAEAGNAPGILGRSLRRSRRAFGPRSLLLAFGVFAAGCGGWRETLLPPEFLVQREHPSRVRVTLRDGTRTVVARPTAVNGCLVGTCRDAAIPNMYVLDGGRVRVPFSEITAVDTRSPWDPTGAIALVVAGAAVGLLAFSAIFISGWS
jgi:hypothetical protein